jgi:hypothetical protein
MNTAGVNPNAVAMCFPRSGVRAAGFSSARALETAFPCYFFYRFCDFF